MRFKLGVGDPTVRRYIEVKKEMIPKALRMFGIEFYRQVTISTPVDTGRARYGWNCSVGEPNFSIPAAAPPGWVGQAQGGGAYYQIAETRADETFALKKISGPQPVIYISNAVPYAKSLNEGHSRQAPARFVELAFTNTVDKLKIYLKAK